MHTFYIRITWPNLKFLAISPATSLFHTVASDSVAFPENSAFALFKQPAMQCDALPLYFTSSRQNGALPHYFFVWFFITRRSYFFRPSEVFEFCRFVLTRAHEQLMHSAGFRGLIWHPKYSVSILATFSSLPYSVSAKIFGLNFSLEKSIRWQQPFFWPVDPLTVIRTSIYDKIEYTPATLLILSLRYAMPTSWYMSCCKIFLKIMRIST